MRKLTMLKAALVIIGLSATVAVPVATAGAANASTVKPYVHRLVFIAEYPDQINCSIAGSIYAENHGADGYYCTPHGTTPNPPYDLYVMFS
jgi:hypothetical protein